MEISMQESSTSIALLMMLMKRVQPVPVVTLTVRWGQMQPLTAAQNQTL